MTVGLMKTPRVRPNEGYSNEFVLQMEVYLFPTHDADGVNRGHGRRILWYASHATTRAALTFAPSSTL